MSTTSGTVRSLAEQLAHDDDLRARLISEPQAVLDELGISTAGEVVPGTVTLPSADELAGLVTASGEEPEVHGADTEEVHGVDAPEIHGVDAPEIHGVDAPEEIHGADTEEVHGADTEEVHGADTEEVHGADTEAD
jgi:hypothetical protein